MVDKDGLVLPPALRAVLAKLPTNITPNAFKAINRLWRGCSGFSSTDLLICLSKSSLELEIREALSVRPMYIVDLALRAVLSSCKYIL